ncbi:MAG TPA: extracellular solute-binding protein, partial [Chloroflexota bacterium]|nr:extracellular solute-binding protein [Chloroflexota bacterium]
RDKSVAYDFVSYVSRTVTVNRYAVPESQLSTLRQLSDAAWRGKVAMQDPRFASGGAGVMAVWLVDKGEDSVRTFLRDQQPVITRDNRQLAEWVVRNQYPVGIAVSVSTLAELSKSGLDLKAVKPLIDDDPGSVKLSHASGGVGLINKAPHPNAARVLINWLLSTEGQTVYAKETGYNVRRLDAPVADPDSALDPAKRYVEVQDEEHIDAQVRASAIAQEVLK